MTADEFELLTIKAQPHHRFKLDWSSYYSLGYADTFLPKVGGYKGSSIRFYDGANLLKNLRKSDRKDLQLINSKKLISIIGYSYPKGVLAENRKETVIPAKHEVCTFIEVAQNDDIEVSYKFGDNFKQFLASQKLSSSALEERTVQTNINDFQKHFDNTLNHDSMMRYVLGQLGINASSAYSYDFTARLQELMIANGVNHFIYSNECKQIEAPSQVIRIEGRIIEGKLDVKVLGIFSKVSDITGLTYLDDATHFLVIERSNGWEVFDKTIDDSFFADFCAQISSGSPTVDNETLEQIFKEFGDVGISEKPREGNDLSQYNAIASKILEQIGNPFYQGTTYCVDIEQLGSDGKVLAEQSIKNGIDEECEITLKISLDNKGEVKIKHQVSKNYLKEHVKTLQEEADSRGIDVDVEELRQQVLADFTAIEREQTFFKRFIQDSKALLSDNVASYFEGIQATQKIAKHVWKDQKINQSTWLSKSPEHEKWPVYVQLNPVVGGVTDGVVDEITGIPMAIRGVYDIVTDEKQQEALKQIFTKEGFSQLVNGLKKEAGEVLNDADRTQHFTGKTTVSVASMAIPGVQITKLGKVSDVLESVTDGLKEITNPKVLSALENLKKKERYNPNLGKKIEDFLKNIDPKLLDKLADAPGFGQTISDMGRHWKSFWGGKFVIEYANILLRKGKLIKFEVNDLSNDLRRIYDIVVEDVLPDGTKFTRNFELKSWNGFYPDSIRKQFTKDLQKMESLESVGWVFNKKGVASTLESLKENVIKTLRKSDGSPIDELVDTVELEQVQKLFPKLIDEFDESDYLDFLIDKLDEDEIFDTIFEVVDVTQ